MAKKPSAVVAQSGGPTTVINSSMCGQMAVKYALSGETGKMVTLIRDPGEKYKCTIGLAALSDVANGEKKVPKEYINKAGLPVYMRFERKLVEKNCQSICNLRKPNKESISKEPSVKTGGSLLDKDLK
jgi:hypothetical protein